ncbi:MAG: hypothetical protein QF639_05585 [Rhodospirillales bacterium]|nr:hypothetical protein [Rhodospirillales bacterium]MDP7242218.1 hypothetical protein [Rhodospirillales bacterium]HJO72544.1 hypothetical protein [Rhodospirillales bacterium]
MSSPSSNLLCCSISRVAAKRFEGLSVSRGIVSGVGQLFQDLAYLLLEFGGRLVEGGLLILEGEELLVDFGTDPGGDFLLVVEQDVQGALEVGVGTGKNNTKR